MPTINELRTNDTRVWEAFFAVYEPVIRAIAGWPRWHFDGHTREDAVQIVKAGIVQSIGRLQSEAALTAFVRKIAVHRCIDLLRKQLRLQNRLLPIGHLNADGEWEETDAVAGADFDPVAEVQRVERAHLLRLALARLAADERECLLQFYAEGLSYREMATRQRVAVNTVGSRLSRSLAKLRKLLEPGDAAPEG